MRTTSLPRLGISLALLASGAAACADRSSPLEADRANGSPAFDQTLPTAPIPVSGTFDFGPVCEFPLDVTYTGKAGTIPLPDGTVIFTSPGLTAVVRNGTDPTKAVTLTITGSFFVSQLPGGITQTVVTGSNLLWDPIAGFVLASGRFSYAFDANGVLVQPLAGQGKLTDVCALVS